jgi:hypothetical protein
MLPFSVFSLVLISDALHRFGSDALSMPCIFVLASDPLLFSGVKASTYYVASPRSWRAG